MPEYVELVAPDYCRVVFTRLFAKAYRSALPREPARRQICQHLAMGWLRALTSGLDVSPLREALDRYGCAQPDFAYFAARNDTSLPRPCVYYIAKHFSYGDA